MNDKQLSTVGLHGSGAAKLIELLGADDQLNHEVEHYYCIGRWRSNRPA